MLLRALLCREGSSTCSMPACRASWTVLLVCCTKARPWSSCTLNRVVIGYLLAAVVMYVFLISLHSKAADVVRHCSIHYAHSHKSR